VIPGPSSDSSGPRAKLYAIDDDECAVAYLLSGPITVKNKPDVDLRANLRTILQLVVRGISNSSNALRDRMGGSTGNAVCIDEVPPVPYAAVCFACTRSSKAQTLTPETVVGQVYIVCEYVATGHGTNHNVAQGRYGRG